MYICIYLHMWLYFQISSKQLSKMKTVKHWLFNHVTIFSFQFFKQHFWKQFFDLERESPSWGDLRLNHSDSSRREYVLKGLPWTRRINDHFTILEYSVTFKELIHTNILCDILIIYVITQSSSRTVFELSLSETISYLQEYIYIGNWNHYKYICINVI